MSGTAIRITSVPSSSNPIQALDQSLSQTQRPYGCRLQAKPRPAARRGPLGSGSGPSRSDSASISAGSSTVVSSGWPIGSVSPRSTKLRRRSSSGSMPSRSASRSICPS